MIACPHGCPQSFSKQENRDAHVQLLHPAPPSTTTRGTPAAGGDPGFVAPGAQTPPAQTPPAPSEAPPAPARFRKGRPVEGSPKFLAPFDAALEEKKPWTKSAALSMHRGLLRGIRQLQAHGAIPPDALQDYEARCVKPNQVFAGKRDHWNSVLALLKVLDAIPAPPAAPAPPAPATASLPPRFPQTPSVPPVAGPVARLVARQDDAGEAAAPAVGFQPVSGCSCGQPHSSLRAIATCRSLRSAPAQPV